MFDELYFIWEEWRHIVALLICFWFYYDCRIQKRILITPTDFYWWGMITVGLYNHFKNLPVG